VRIHVGSAEVLLDDSLRFATKAEQAGIDCEVHVWEGMIHVFPSNLAILQAAAEAVEEIGSCLAGKRFLQVLEER
jgi:acetyl esterase/lipase